MPVYSAVSSHQTTHVQRHPRNNNDNVNIAPDNLDTTSRPRTSSWKVGLLVFRSTAAGRSDKNVYTMRQIIRLVEAAVFKSVSNIAMASTSTGSAYYFGIKVRCSPDAYVICLRPLYRFAKYCEQPCVCLALHAIIIINNNNNNRQRSTLIDVMLQRRFCRLLIRIQSVYIHLFSP